MLTGEGPIFLLQSRRTLTMKNTRISAVSIIFTGTFFVLLPKLHAYEAPCSRGDFRSVSEQVFSTLPDGKKQLIGTTCRAGVADIPTILSLLEKRPKDRDSSYFMQASGALQDLIRAEPTTRTAGTKARLLALAKSSDYAINDGAMDCLMEFKRDPDIRAFFVETLHSNPNEGTRGKATGRLAVNTERDPTIFPELRKALTDPSDFVKVRAAQDLARMGDYSGLPLMKTMLAEIPSATKSDSVMSHTVRAAGEFRHQDLLEPLKRIAALGKEAPDCSREARSAVRLAELTKISDSTEKTDYLRRVAQQKDGLFWIERTLLNQMDILGVTKDEIVSALNPAVNSSDWNVSHEAKGVLAILDQMAKKPAR